MQEPYLLLIDGSSLLSTQYYGNLPREILFAKTAEEKARYYHKIMMTSEGVYTNAVFGFLRTLFSILKNQRPAYLAFAWDLTRDTFRRALYPEYKGNRSETPEPLKQQFAVMQDALRDMGIPQFMSETFEADDYCGTLASRFEGEVPVRILTKDQDYLQLVTDRTHIWMMHATAEKTAELYKKYRIQHPDAVPERVFELTPALVEAEYGVKPSSVAALKGLQGDASDNIKGVPGIGHDTAVKLIASYGSVEALYRDIDGKSAAELDALKKRWKETLGISRSPVSYLTKTGEDGRTARESAFLSERLATIKTDIDLGDLSLQDLAVKTERKAVQGVLDRLEIRALKADFPEEEEAEAALAGAVRTVSELREMEETLQVLVKCREFGVSRTPDGTLYVACPDLTVYRIPLSFFITPDAMGRLLSMLARSGAEISVFGGKDIVRLGGDAYPDVSVMAYLLDPLRNDYGIRYIAETYTDLPVKKEGQDGVYEAVTALKARPALEGKLREAGMWTLFTDVEVPTMGALARLEDIGIRADRDALLLYGKEVKAEEDRLRAEIMALAGEDFNPNSPKQLSEILFVKLGIPYPGKAKGGYSTAADILEKLAPDHEIVRKVLSYRTYAKLRTTYAEGLLSCIREDGRIHCRFHQTVTATGRISSSDPNLQNIPAREEIGRKIRKVFVPADGCVFVDADYSQIELRVLAHLAGDQTLIDAFRNRADIHTLTASQVFNVPVGEVTPELRRAAKAVNFGIVYGISAFSLAEDLSVSRKEAEAYIAKYFETYPGIRRYLQDTVDRAKEQGFVRTMFGRVRPIPELRSPVFSQRSFGERAAMNSPIQGTAADIMKIAVIRVEKALKDAGLSSRIVLQIHDEIVVEAPVSEADAAKEILEREMRGAAALSVSLDVDAKTGESLYETK
ncbi:MAG: DNA polymerase I [Lachnospiraceae bacterium]|nr:DNA polymerase I [Lachnospiraceae bacterium]